MVVCGRCEQPCHLVEGFDSFDYEYGSIRGVERFTIDITSCCRTEDYYEVEDPEEAEE